MNRIRTWTMSRLTKWLEPELFQPFVFGVLISLTLSEFVRGALTLSLLPTYGRNVLGFAVEWTALALSIHYLADNLLRSPAGWIADKFGQRTVLLIGFAIAAGSVVWMMNARHLWSLFASLALYGCGVTPMWPSAVSGIGVATPEKTRAQFMGYMYIFWMAGTGLGPVLINFIIGRTYSAAFWLLVAIDLLGFTLVWVLVRRKTMTAVGSAASGSAAGVPVGVLEGVSEGAADRPLSANGTREYWRSLWNNVKQVAFLFPGMFAQTFAVASLLPILSLYAKVILGFSGALYSGMLIFGGVFAVLLLIPAGKLVDRFGARRFLVPAYLSAAVCLAIVPLVPTRVLIFAAVGLIGCCYGFILPAWNSVLDRSIDPDKKGTLWGVFMTVEGFGSAVGPYLGGLVWDTISPRAPFLVSAAVIFVMGLLYMVLPIDRPRRVGGADAGRAGTVGAGTVEGVDSVGDAGASRGAGGPGTADVPLREPNPWRRKQRT